MHCTKAARNYDLSSLFIGPTEKMGRGVFTSEPLEADSVIEISPVIVMSADERKLLDQTTLHDYLFEWGSNRKHAAWRLATCLFTIIPINPIVNMRWTLMPDRLQ
jgi:hypothetical protein